MKLIALTYVSPNPTEGTFENVYIEDISYEVRRNCDFFAIVFQMYIIKNETKIKLDEFQITFKGSNADLEQGLPTTNRTTLIRVPQSEDYIPESYYEDEEGNTIITPQVGTPEMVIPLMQYVINNQGAFPPLEYVIDWGYPTSEDAMQYFSGGELGNPELFLINDFAKMWLLNNVQMKGEFIKEQFNFVD